MKIGGLGGKAKGGLTVEKEGGRGEMLERKPKSVFNNLE